MADHVVGPISGLKRRLRILARFKTLIRTVILNISWLNEQEERRITENVNRNIAVFTRRRNRTSALTKDNKILLLKPKWKRTIEDRKKLVLLVAGLKCFQNFPPKVRARVTPFLTLMIIQKGRMIIREGDTPIYVYFMLSGEAVASKKVYDSIKKEMITREKLIYVPGDMIGQNSFIQNSIRLFSVRATRDIEALCINEDEFRMHLLPIVKHQADQKLLALNKFDYFNNWTKMQIGFALQFAQIKQYEPMETIYHRDRGILNSMYFIITGECMILQRLETAVRTRSKGKTYELCPIVLDNQLEDKFFGINKNVELFKEFRIEKSETIISTNTTSHKLKEDENLEIENHFIDVGTLSEGFVFGLGETMEHRAIIGRTIVQCLLLPRFWLLERDQNPGNMWQRMSFKINSSIPSRNDLFEDFLATKKWKKFKKKLVEDMLDSTKTGNKTKSEDIPVICQLIENNYNDND